MIAVGSPLSYLGDLTGGKRAIFFLRVLTVLPGFVYTKMTEDLDLPKLLTANPADVASAVYTGIKKKKNVIYVKWFWRWIMYIIKAIPESIFKRKQL